MRDIERERERERERKSERERERLSEIYCESEGNNRRRIRRKM